MTFKESDISTLNFIVDSVLKMNGSVYSNTLVEAGLIKETNFKKIEIEFEHFLSIIEAYDCATVNTAKNEDNGANAERNELTAKFSNDGGFTSIFTDLQKSKEKMELKEELETDVLKLQKENLAYSKTIREQEARIRNLEEQTKFIELLKGYWWVLIICIGIGVCLLELLDIIMP